MHSIDADGELFTGTCPYCGKAMQRIDSGYDFERGRPYDRYVCLDCCDHADQPEADVHVDTETDEIL